MKNKIISSFFLTILMVFFGVGLFPVSSSATSPITIVDYSYGPKEESILYSTGGNNVTQYSLNRNQKTCLQNNNSNNHPAYSNNSNNITVTCGTNGNPDTMTQSSTFVTSAPQTIEPIFPGAIEGNWIDHSTLSLATYMNSGITSPPIIGQYFDNKIDSTMSYQYQGNSSACSSQSHIFYNKSVNTPSYQNVSVNASNWYLALYNTGGITNQSNNQSCIETIEPINAFSNTSNYNDYFSYTNSQTIFTSDRTTMAFSSSTPQSFNTVYTANQASNPADIVCKSTIQPSYKNGAITSGWLIISASAGDGINNGNGNPFTSGWPNNIQNATLGTTSGNCNKSNPIKINLSDPTISGKLASQLAPTSASSSLGGSNTGSSTSSTPALSCNTGFNPLNYVLCAIVKGLTSLTVQADNLINKLLNLGVCNGSTSTTPNAIFGQCSNNNAISADYYTAWSSFRNIALGLLVLIGLIIIIAQAIKG